MGINILGIAKSGSHLFTEHRLAPALAHGWNSPGVCAINRPMPHTQPSPVPDSGKSLRLRDAGWALRLTFGALIRLVRARLAFNRINGSEIVARNAAAGRADRPEAANEVLADRIGFVIARLSKRLPWRSDCVIQAFAAQEWLAQLGMGSEIRIGVERPEDGPFAAHAWLVRDERIITGGDISRYSLLLDLQAKVGVGS